MAKRKLQRKDTIKSLKHRLQLKQNAEIRDRIRIIILVLKGMTDASIAMKLDYSIQWVKKWIGRYKHFGFDGLRDQVRSGAPMKLTEDQVMELYQQVLKGPDEKEILARYRILDLQKIISSKWGVDYTIGGLHALMKRMKLSHVTPRPHHPKNDPVVMEIWKKKPKRSSRKNVRSVPGRESRSGSKTSRALARKAW
jgi:transposase